MKSSLFHLPFAIAFSLALLVPGCPKILAENPTTNVTLVNRLGKLPSNPHIVINDPITFKNPADRAAFALELALPSAGLSADITSFLGAANNAAARTSLGLGNVDNTSDATKSFTAAQIHFTMPGSNAGSRSVQELIQEQLPTPQSFGAIGDGSTHPLSTKYGTLAAAQAAYSIAVPSVTVTNGSAVADCTLSSALYFVVGAPVTGTNIPDNTTVSSLAADGAHFTMSANATGTATETVTTTFVISLTQELDYCGLQAVVYAKGSYYAPAGVYLLGASTLKHATIGLQGGQSVIGTGISVRGAGIDLTSIYANGGADAIHIMGKTQTMTDLTIAGTASPSHTPSPNFSTASGITLGEGGYSNSFHLIHCGVRNFNVGFDNRFGWDSCSIDISDFNENFINVLTDSNQDALQMNRTSLGNNTPTFPVVGGATTSGSRYVTVGSSTGMFVGATISGSGIPHWTVLDSVRTSAVSNTTNGSTTLVVGTTQGLFAGTPISGSGIPSSTTIASITDGTHFEISNAATATATGVALSLPVTMTKNATATATGVTFSVATMGLGVYGSGRAEWTGGVSGGNGVSITGISVKAGSVHFEGCDQIYITGLLNGGVQLDNVLFADGFGTFRHVALRYGNAFVTHSSVANAGLGNGRVYVYVDGTADVQSPDHCAIENYNGVVEVVCGDYLIQTGDNPLPIPSAYYRGKRFYQARYPSWDHPDAIYACYDFGGAYPAPRDFTGTTVNGTTTVTVADTSGLLVGEALTGTGVPTNAIINSITTNTSIELSGNATASGTVTIHAAGTLVWAKDNSPTLEVDRGGTGFNSYTAGDILYATGFSSLAKLAKGTDGQVLSLSGGLPVWIDAPGAQQVFTASCSGAVNIPSSYADVTGLSIASLPAGTYAVFIEGGVFPNNPGGWGWKLHASAGSITGTGHYQQIAEWLTGSIHEINGAATAGDGAISSDIAAGQEWAGSHFSGGSPYAMRFTGTVVTTSTATISMQHRYFTTGGDTGGSAGQVMQGTRIILIKQ